MIDHMISHYSSLYYIIVYHITLSYSQSEGAAAPADLARADAPPGAVGLRPEAPGVEAVLLLL